MDGQSPFAIGLWRGAVTPFLSSLHGSVMAVILTPLPPFDFHIFVRFRVRPQDFRRIERLL
jgi:hypothetical protein